MEQVQPNFSSSESSVKLLNNKNKKIIFVGIVAVILLLIVGVVLVYLTNNVPKTSDSTLNYDIEVDQDEDQDKKPGGNNQKTINSDWEKIGYVINGPYADSEVVDLGNGTFRQYYGVEPEVKDGNFKVYSAISSDGQTWTQEEGIRSEGESTFLAPDINKLADGTYRMYFGAREGGIKSAISTDALNWEVQDGIRLPSRSTLVPEVERIGFPTSYTDKNGKVILVYRGNIEKKYGTNTPNSRTTILLWATSDDGVNFVEKGIAIDSRNSVLEGHVDGPEFVVWDDGKVKLFYWGYQGIYSSTFENNIFSSPELVYRDNVNLNVMYSDAPPSDPTIAKIGGKWFMYYGQHEKGIIAARYK